MGKKLYNHENIIFISDFQVNKILETPHLYFDKTFAHPNEFEQLLVVLYYDTTINKRSPGAFILLNNKRENSYIRVFQYFIYLITLVNTIELSILSYNTDLEAALGNALEFVFPKQR